MSVGSVYLNVDKTQSYTVMPHNYIKIQFFSYFFSVHEIVLCVCVCVVAAELIQITAQPQNQQATAGGMVVLTCRASGPPGLSYQWFRGKDEVSRTLFNYVNNNNRISGQSPSNVVSAVSMLLLG